MKRFLALLIILCVYLSGFAFVGCEKEETTVTEEQWRKAFDFSAYENLEYSMEGVDLEIEAEFQGKVARIEKAVYFYEEFPEENFRSEGYIVKDDNQYIYYHKEDEDWKKDSISEFMYENYIDQFMTCQGMNSFAENFSDFTYDEKIKAYVGENFSSGTFDSCFNATVYFGDGKIKKLKVANDVIDAVFTFSYGTAEITLPVVE